MEMPGNCTGPKLLSKNLEKWEGVIWEVMTCQKNGQTGRSPDMVQKVFGIREAKNGTETDELLQAGKC